MSYTPPATANPNGQNTSANSAPVVVSSDQIASGQIFATGAKQDTGNTSLSTISTNTSRIPAQGAAATTASLPVNIASDQTVPVSNTSLPTIATNTGRIPAQGAAATAASLPVNIANDQTVPISNASLTTIATNTGRIPALGQVASTASTPVVIASDQSAVAISNGFLNLPQTSVAVVNGDLVAQIDVSAYKWASLNVLGTFTGTYTFQATNEVTPTTWNSIPALLRTTGQPAATLTSSATNAFWDIPLSFRWLRVRMTSYTSGTATGNLALYATATGMMSTTGFVTQSGTWNVNSILTTSAGSAGLLSYVNASTSALAVVKGSAGRLHRIIIQNPNTSVAWVQIFNAATTGAVTLGTTAALYSVPILASGVFEDFFDYSDTFSAGIVIAATTTATGATAPTTALYVSLGYV